MLWSQGGILEMRRPLLLITLLGASLVPCVAATDGTPTGWLLAGDHPQNYKVGMEGDGIAYIASKTGSDGDGFGTLMQSVRADEYAGKRVRFSAMVRSENVSRWAGLWARVDAGDKTVAFDNMQSRPIKGTSEWKRYEVVLIVPINATKISFGSLMASNGEIWLKDLSFDAVDSDLPATGGRLPAEKPVNLNFKQ